MDNEPNERQGDGHPAEDAILGPDNAPVERDQADTDAFGDYLQALGDDEDITDPFAVEAA